MRRKILKNQSGFTIPELIIVMVLTLLFSTMLMSFAFDYWGRAGSLQNSSDTLVTRQNIGDSLRNRLNAASSLLNQNSLPDANANTTDPLDLTGNHWPILHAIPEKIDMPPPDAYTPILYYATPSIDSSKHFIMRGVNPYQDEFILYLDGKKRALMVRALANDSPDASGNILLTSCPANKATEFCPADRTLAEDVGAVSMKYFSKSGNPINWYAVTDPETGQPIGPDFPDVEVVELTLYFKKRAVIKGTADSISSTTVRVALRNG